MKKSPSSGASQKVDFGHKKSVAGVSAPRGVPKVDYGAAGANVRRTGIDKVDAKRGKKR